MYLKARFYVYVCTAQRKVSMLTFKLQFHWKFNTYLALIPVQMYEISTYAEHEIEMIFILILMRFQRFI